MEKKDNFKKFVSNHPELITNVRNNKMTWQKYYEIYDLFGEDIDKWAPYLNDDERTGIGKINLASIGSIVKKVNVNNINKHVNTAQKAINLFQEFTAKKTSSLPTSKGPGVLRPINKFFED